YASERLHQGRPLFERYTLRRPSPTQWAVLQSLQRPRLTGDRHGLERRPVLYASCARRAAAAEKAGLHNRERAREQRRRMAATLSDRRALKRPACDRRWGGRPRLFSLDGVRKSRVGVRVAAL